jgi:hypothetical protein
MPHLLPPISIKISVISSSVILRYQEFSRDNWVCVNRSVNILPYTVLVSLQRTLQWVFSAVLWCLHMRKYLKNKELFLQRQKYNSVREYKLSFCSLQYRYSWRHHYYAGRGSAEFLEVPQRAVYIGHIVIKRHTLSLQLNSLNNLLRLWKFCTVQFEAPVCRKIFKHYRNCELLILSEFIASNSSIKTPQ